MKFSGCGGEVQWEDIKVSHFLTYFGLLSLSFNLRVLSKIGSLVHHSSNSKKATISAWLDSTEPSLTKTSPLLRRMSRRSVVKLSRGNPPKVRPSTSFTFSVYLIPHIESEEREFLIERAQTAAKRAFSSTTRGKGAPRGRGGRGGRRRVRVSLARAGRPPRSATPPGGRCG